MVVTKEHAEKLSRALEATGLAQPVSANHAEDRITVLCRVPNGNEDKWVELVKSILVGALDEEKEAHAWKAHICRNYFIKESPEGDRKLVWGWNISIQSREMGHSLVMIIKLLKGEPIRITNSREITEFPLHGAGPNRNAVKNGKGVHTIGGSAGDFHPTRK